MFRVFALPFVFQAFPRFHLFLFRILFSFCLFFLFPFLSLFFFCPRCSLVWSKTLLSCALISKSHHHVVKTLSYFWFFPLFSFFFFFFLLFFCLFFGSLRWLRLLVLWFLSCMWKMADSSKAVPLFLSFFPSFFVCLLFFFVFLLKFQRHF